MKYLIISDTAEINGGGAKVAITAARGFADNGNTVVFFAGGGKTHHSLLHPNIKVINLGMKNLIQGNRFVMFFNGINNTIAKKELSKLLNSININEYEIHVHSWVKTLSPSIFVALRKNKCRFFITTHDYFLVCPNGGLYNYPKCQICHKKGLSASCLFTNCDSRNYVFKLWRWIRFVYQTKCINKCNYSLIHISNVTSQIIKLKEKNDYLIKNPIDLYLEKNIVFEEKLFYAYIGRLSNEKGVDLFCEAMAKTGKNAFIIGTGPLEKQLKNKYKTFNNIVFLGWIKNEEIKGIYKKIKALIFPSIWYEGAPLIIPEVQSYGIPCIVSDACSGKEYIHEGENGFVFSSANVESLIDKINKLESVDNIEDIRQKTRQIAFQENYGIKGYVNSILEIEAHYEH